VDRAGALAAPADLTLDRRSVGMMLVEMSPDHPEVARIRSEQEIGNRADPRDEAEQEVETDITRHARQLPFRHAEIARFPDNISAERRAGDVADSRHQVEDDVQADGSVDSGNDEEPLEEMLHRLDAPANGRWIRPYPGEGQPIVTRNRHLTDCLVVAAGR